MIVKVISTRFPALEYYRKVASGKMTIEEYSKLKQKYLRPVTQIWYEDFKDYGEY